MVILQNGYDDSEETSDKIYKWVLAGTIVLFLLYQIYIEVIQSIGITFKDYFQQPSNFIDVYTFGASALLIIVQLMEIDWPAIHI